MHDAVAIGCQAVVVRPARCRLVHDTGSGAWTVHGRILRQYVRCFVLDISYAFTDFLSSRKKNADIHDNDYVLFNGHIL